MNKADLIASVADGSGITKAQASSAIDALTDAVAKALVKGDKVTLVGFGTFSISDRKARQGRNPKTGEPIEVKAKKTVKFKAGKELGSSI